MQKKALIFDFDGIIIDTETPEYISWTEIYTKHGATLPLEVWEKAVGSSREAFNPLAYLAEQISKDIDLDKIDMQQQERSISLAMEQPILPGVVDYLKDAKLLGMKLAIASSSHRDWVHGNLKRVGLFEYFDVICTCDQVEKVKPDPDLFNFALEQLGLIPDEAIVFEDSPNGIKAAKKAGLFCVAIPNTVTKDLIDNHADLIINSLADLPLSKLLARF